MKIWEINPYRMIRKDKRFSPIYRGPEPTYRPPKCRFCGMPMVILADIGNSVIWGCETTGCPNNQDTYDKFYLTRQQINSLGNPYRKNGNWSPR